MSETETTAPVETKPARKIIGIFHVLNSEIGSSDKLEDPLLRKEWVREGHDQTILENTLDSTEVINGGHDYYLLKFTCDGAEYTLFPGDTLVIHDDGVLSALVGITVTDAIISALTAE